MFVPGFSTRDVTASGGLLVVPDTGVVTPPVDPPVDPPTVDPPVVTPVEPGAPIPLPPLYDGIDGQGLISIHSICSNALVRVGDDPLTAVEFEKPQSKGAVVMRNLYETTYRSYLTSYPWTFATVQARLNRLDVEPLLDYRYAYQLPTGILRLLRVEPDYPYSRNEDRIHTDAESVDLVYTFRAREENLPWDFVEALQLKLAAVAAIPITGNRALQNELLTLYQTQNAAARTTDAQSAPLPGFDTDLFIHARY